MQAVSSSSSPRQSSSLRSSLLVAVLLLVSQLLWPLAAFASASAQPTFTPLSASELGSVLGGCWSNCDGDDGGSSGSDEEEEDDPEPTKVGSPYWSYAYRSLIERPNVAGDLVWHRINSTDSPWGPFEVSYEHREKYNWSVGASVPRSIVSAQLGGAYETLRTESVSFTIPARTYYKFFVAYPYERWRYYYKEYQDYSDGTRQVLDSGSATVYDMWTKTNLVQGPVY